MTGYRFHPEAEDDLNRIWDYIAADSRDAADRIAGEIRRTLDSLASFPHQGHRRPNIASRRVRFKAVRDYLIAYAP